jgi:N-acetyl-anhydromuramyl-L-alanine amidase AmpD
MAKKIVQIENPTDLIIDTDNYKISDNNYNNKITVKNKIFLISSLMLEDDYFKRLEIKNNKEYPHFFISDKGIIYQHYNIDYYNDITKNVKFNKSNITICLENLGWLTENDNGNFVNWYGVQVNENRTYKKPYRERLIWHTYNKLQMNSLKNLINHLCNSYNIKNESIGHVFTHDEYTNYEGIICRSNINDNYTDLNPAFDFKIF